MERTAHNPWSWQDPLGFVQAVEITEPRRVLAERVCADFGAPGRGEALLRALDAPA